MFDNKRNYICQSLFAIVLLSLSGFSSATSMVLSIEDGSFVCFDISPGFCDGSSFSPVGHEGIRIGETQSASGAHNGLPDGSENPGIDEPWSILGMTGMHLTTSPILILSQDTNSMELDFSGWSAIWGEDATTGLPYFFELGTGASAGDADGIALLSCGFDCSNGDTYVLRYTATVGGSDILDGVQYSLHLAGTISYVPVPAAVWLFASGLFGLIGFA